MVAIETITSCLSFHEKVNKCTSAGSFSNDQRLGVAIQGD